MLTKDEIQLLADLVVAGGKSPVTGGDGLMKAADAIRILQREATEAEAAERKAQETPPSEG
jgi:hypothetical protein